MGSFVDKALIVAIAAFVVVIAGGFAFLLWWRRRSLNRAPSSPKDMRHVLRKWYATCRELGDPEKLVRTAVIASVPLGGPATAWVAP